MKFSSLRFIAFGLASMAISAASSAQAGTLYWDTSTQAGSQVGNNPWDLTTLTWSTTTGGTGGTTLTNWADDSDAVFATPTSGASSLLTVGNGSTIKVKSISVQSSGQNPTFRATGTGAIQLSTSSGNALTNSGGSGLTVDAPLILAGTNAGYFANSGAGTLTINGDISESGGSRIVRILSGTVSLNGTNSTTGGTKVGAGATVSASKAGAIGSGVIGLEANTAGTTGFKANFSANGTLGNAVTFGLGGDGTSTGVTISSTGAGAVRFSNSASVGWGTAPVGSGAKLGAFTLKFSGTSTASNTFAGAIGDSGTGSNITSVVKDEAGTWILSGNNTYSGGTKINAGSLLLQDSGTLGTGNLSLAGGTLDIGGISASTYTISQTQSVSGTGTIKGAAGKSIQIANLAAGTQPGTITLDTLTLILSGSTNISLSNPSFATGTYNLVNQVNGGGVESIVFGGALTLNFSGGAYTSGSSVQLFDVDSYSGNFSSISYSGLGEGQSVSFDQLTGVLTVVPEPGTNMLLMLALLIGVVYLPRRGVAGIWKRDAQ